MLELLAAAAIELPRPTLNTAKALVRRVPHINEGESTAVQVSLFVGPNGRVIECTLLRAGGTERIADALCEEAIGVKVKPGRDERSEKTHALFSTILSAFADGEGALREPLTNLLTATPLPADLFLELQKMPEALAEKPRIAVRVRVDEAGSVVACQPGDEDRPKISDVACSQAKLQTFDVKRAKKGTAVSYIRSVIIDFKLEG